MGLTLLEGKEKILTWSGVNLNPSGLDYSAPERHSIAPAVLEEVAACISCCTTPLQVFWSVLSFEKSPFNRKYRRRSSRLKQTRIVIGPCWDNSNKQLTASECAGERERGGGMRRHKWKKIAFCTIWTVLSQLSCTGHIAHLLPHSPETWFNMDASCLRLLQSSNNAFLALICLVELAGW